MIVKGERINTTGTTVIHRNCYIIETYYKVYSSVTFEI